MGQRQADLAQAEKTKTYKQSGQHNLSSQNYPLSFFKWCQAPAPSALITPTLKALANADCCHSKPHSAKNSMGT